tara:strand:- start:81621 stop:82262 length:642 start_codon:yes stop_codon:yes gene_type:complete
MEVQNLNHTLRPNWDQFSGALIFEAFRGDKVFTSTCVAINSTTLITAAHSAENIDFAFVHLESGYDQKAGMRLKVIKTYIHPGYDGEKSNFKHDLAIIKLAHPLPRHIRTYSISSLVPTALERIGFGARNNQNLRNWTLVKLRERFESYLVLEDHCSVIGDSGGPLFIQRKGIYQLVAIHSTREGDSKTYAVRLDYYRDWIEEKARGFFLLEA